MRRILRLAVACLFVLAACSDPEAPKVQPGADDPSATAPAADRVETQRVVEGRVSTSLLASGAIRARRVTSIGSEVAGRLAEVLVDVGDSVEAGDPLFRIEPGPYQMALAEARAGLALARAESQNAAQEVDRVAKLVAERAASEQHFDKLRTAAAVARARVEQMEARFARARRDLDKTVVRAPYAGSIVERRAHEGAMAGPEPILVLQETGALEAVLTIPDAWPVAVRVGDEVLLHVEGLAEPLATRIHRVSDRVDVETHTYEVRGVVHDPSRTVKAGSYVRAEIVTGSPEPGPVVARSAVLTRDGRTYVFRVSGDTVERVPVRVGVTNQDRAQILSGIETGEEVVHGEAVPRLESGARIERIADLSTARAEEAP